MHAERLRVKPATTRDPRALVLVTPLTSRDGSLRHLAVVFTDLEGFTAYTDTQGDAVALKLIQDHHRAGGPVVRQ